MSSARLMPGARTGTVAAPPSKSHAHRLLIARFLAGDTTCLADEADDSADIAATRRCLRALADGSSEPVLDCGESGSTLRFLAPVAAALGKRPRFVKAGRLAARPTIDYPVLEPGLHVLEGNVSSQFVTGLLFALPILTDDSQIRFSSPLESRGYVDLSLAVLREADIIIRETAEGFDIPGGQSYRVPSRLEVEGDWSGAAFWLAMNALGSSVDVRGLDARSAQPDRAIVAHLRTLTATDAENPVLDVSSCPDIFPVLTVVAAARDGRTRFTGTRRLRLKESDRVAAMADVLSRLGRAAEVRENEFLVTGSSAPFPGGCAFTAFGDHRIAMSVAVAATRANAPLELDDIRCADKSYPGFFDLFSASCTAGGTAAFGLKFSCGSSGRCPAGGRS